MAKWIELAVIAVVIIFVALACLGMYVTWRDCRDIGGTAVRGVFALECIKR